MDAVRRRNHALTDGRTSPTVTRRRGNPGPSRDVLGRAVGAVEPERYGWRWCKMISEQGPQSGRSRPSRGSHANCSGDDTSSADDRLPADLDERILARLGLHGRRSTAGYTMHVKQRLQFRDLRAHGNGRLLRDSLLNDKRQLRCHGLR